MKLLTVFAALTILAAVCGPAYAEPRYVTDDLKITLRKGQDSSYRVVKELSAGTRLEVLSENKETGYSRVETPDGTEGHVLTRYLTSEVPARVRVARLEQELEELRENPGATKKELTQLQSKYQTLKLKYDTLEFENIQLSQRMEAIRENASNVVDLMDERDEALQRANRLSAELDELRVKNMELENHSDKKWFMAGAGVLVLGVLVGIIIPRVGVRRRRRLGSDEFSF